MPKWLRNNGLSITMFLLFAISLVGQVAAGNRVHNTDQQEHGQPAVELSEYLRSGHFMESVFENWESEFLQMAAFVVQSEFLSVGVLVVLSVFLRERHSPESKPVADPHFETGR